MTIVLQKSYTRILISPTEGNREGSRVQCMVGVAETRRRAADGPVYLDARAAEEAVYTDRCEPLADQQLYHIRTLRAHSRVDGLKFDQWPYPGSGESGRECVGVFVNDVLDDREIWTMHNSPIEKRLTG
ncbi:uncharacterized protein PG998_012102 [Apiospora kogelbergensis]|uniref:uncharacterized protein n=1 Tax=Apiospora kogelbergensis TaxID=1337665 RepID=UPI0031306C47